LYGIVYNFVKNVGFKFEITGQLFADHFLYFVNAQLFVQLEYFAY
jgi:hypothetical protein